MIKRKLKKHAKKRDALQSKLDRRQAKLRRAVIKAHRKGKDTTKIAKHTGLSTSRINDIIREDGPE